MRSLLLTLSAAALLAGCASSGASEPPPLNPLSRYSLQTEPGLDRIALAVHEDGLSQTQIAALRELAARYAGAGVGRIQVQGPSGDDPAASRQTWAVRSALEAVGVPARNIEVTGYDAPDPRAPVLAGFETVRAAIPNCAAERRDMGSRFSNESSPGLGCAITANMAAQIADPRDILAARAVSPADSGRAAVVFDNYRKGQATSAPQETLIQGGISRAVD
ncbi:CpaD family pilus assembly lipoprotein [Brevundimonas sp. M20]|uniref:CpaD family pilus assembly protein n=1 Tax=Brevundimonas sp. M20 TaxID=2591463 RepID=UPI001F0DE059|nr:CpaD family pilus assembly lipoprotein [Brevundimonas sp. M20]